MEEQRLLGPRAGEKIRDMLVKQKPGMAIRQIQERSGLNDNNQNNKTLRCCSFVYCFEDMHSVLCFIVFSDSYFCAF